jgi:hypothetical protein
MRRSRDQTLTSAKQRRVCPWRSLRYASTALARLTTLGGVAAPLVVVVAENHNNNINRSNTNRCRNRSATTNTWMCQHKLLLILLLLQRLLTPTTIATAITNTTVITTTITSPLSALYYSSVRTLLERAYAPHLLSNMCFALSFVVW